MVHLNEVFIILKDVIILRMLIKTINIRNSDDSWDVISKKASYDITAYSKKSFFTLQKSDDIKRKNDLSISSKKSKNIHTVSFQN